MREAYRLSVCGEETVDHRLGLTKVAAAEQVEVIQDVIEVVEIDARPGRCRQRPRGLISGVERCTESAEQSGHRQIGLAITVVHRRVEYDRGTVLVGRSVAAPQ